MSVIQFDAAGYSIAGSPIVRDLDLQIEEGETLLVLGRSGSGKTTMLKLVNDLLTPTAGTVFVQGKSTQDWDRIALRRRIGYVIQDVGLFPHFTIGRNVGLVPELERWDQQRIRKRVDETLELVGLSPAHFAHRYPRELSGGQRQRVGVARALAADPPILLMDEPFGSLDPITRSEIQKEFLRLQQHLKKTTVFVTHDVTEALLLGSRIALMQEGRLDEVSTGSEFLNSKNPSIRIFLTSAGRFTKDQEGPHQ